MSTDTNKIAKIDFYKKKKENIVSFFNIIPSETLSVHVINHLLTDKPIHLINRIFTHHIYSTYFSSYITLQQRMPSVYSFNIFDFIAEEKKNHTWANLSPLLQIQIVSGIMYNNSIYQHILENLMKTPMLADVVHAFIQANETLSLDDDNNPTLKKEKEIINGHYANIKKCVNIFLKFERRMCILNLIYWYSVKSRLKTTNDLVIKRTYIDISMISKKKFSMYLWHNIKHIDPEEYLRLIPNDTINKYNQIYTEFVSSRPENQNVEPIIDNLLLSNEKSDFSQKLSTLNKLSLNVMRTIFQKIYTKGVTNEEQQSVLLFIQQKLSLLCNGDKKITDGLKQKIDLVLHNYNYCIEKSKQKLVINYCIEESKQKMIINPTTSRIKRAGQKAYLQKSVKELKKQELGQIDLMLGDYFQYYLLYHSLQKHKKNLPEIQITQKENYKIYHYSSSQILYRTVQDLIIDNDQKIKNPILDFLNIIDRYYPELRYYEYDKTSYDSDYQKKYHILKYNSLTEECNLSYQLMEYINLICIYKYFLIDASLTQIDIDFLANLNKDPSIVWETLCHFVNEVSHNYKYNIISKNENDLEFLIIPRNYDIIQGSLRLVFLDWSKDYEIATLYNIVTQVLGYPTIQAFRNAAINAFNVMDERAFYEVKIAIYHLEGN